MGHIPLAAFFAAEDGDWLRPDFASDQLYLHRRGLRSLNRERLFAEMAPLREHSRQVLHAVPFVLR